MNILHVLLIEYQPNIDTQLRLQEESAVMIFKNVILIIPRSLHIIWMNIANSKFSFVRNNWKHFGEFQLKIFVNCVTLVKQGRLLMTQAGDKANK